MKPEQTNPHNMTIGSLPSNATNGGVPFAPVTPKLSKKEREYIQRLKDRAQILINRIASSELNDNSELQMELNALNWAIDRLEQ